MAAQGKTNRCGWRREGSVLLPDNNGRGHRARLRPLGIGTALASMAHGDSGYLQSRLIVLYAGLIAANLSAWVWALVAFHGSPILLGTAVLAYTLGLRHAFDADHIAAIDNVTRKLMQ
jgi:hypothetical protein